MFARIAKRRYHTRVVRSAQHLYNTHPMLPNGAVGFALFFSTDVVAQFNHLTRQNNEESGTATNNSTGTTVDVVRSAKMGMYGGAMNGICIHAWFLYLDRIFGKHGWNSVLSKLVADQLVFAPFADSTFLVWAAVLKGGSIQMVMDTAKNNLEQSFIRAYITDCTVWPFANLIGFRLVPTHYRPTFIGVVQLGWQVYMASIGHEHAGDKNNSESKPDPVESDNASALAALVAFSQKIEFWFTTAVSNLNSL